MTAPDWMLPEGIHEVRRAQIERDYARRERRAANRRAVAEICEGTPK